ncbi:MAG: DNA-binding protein [Coprobacillus cateniformis]|uniref:DNA-binding protein n=1 Tax=Longibaculum muris TaxID=1796628 RepID=UPI003AB82E3A|nr:DNA-binding protein [Coprobacillus cateniformis]
MNFLTTAEISKIWKVLRRRVSALCNEGRVDGTILKGKTWLIPEGTNKPDDPRRIQKNAHCD